MAQHEIKTIVAELQSMSPRTQLEIVRLCKKVAELTPDYIDTLAAEAAEEIMPLINANTAAINQEVTERKAIVELVGNTNKMKSNGNDSLAGVYVSDSSTGLINSNLIELIALANLITAASITLDTNKNVKIKSGNYESVFNEDTFTTYQIAATDIYADGIYSKPNGNEILIDCGNKQIKLDKSTHEITLTNNEHVLKLDASGNLTLDGNAVGGGGKHYFRHEIRISSSNNFNGMITIINDSNTPLNTYNALASFIYNTYGSGLTGAITITGAYYSSSVLYSLYGIGASSATSLKIYSQNTTNGNSSEYSLPTSSGITLIYENITEI